MKILIVSQYFWPENFRINDLVSGLVTKGHDVTVLTGKPNYPAGSYFSGYSFFSKSKETYNGINIRRVPLLPRGRGGTLRLILNYISFVFFGLLLSPIYCRGKYDLIFVYEPSPITVGIPARFLGWLKNAPIIFWVQDLWPESLAATGTTSNKYILTVVGKLVKWIYAGCALTLIQSRTFENSIKQHGVSESRIRYYPNSAESLYKPVTANRDTRLRLGLPEGFIVMFAGNIGVSQDFASILSAAQKTRDIPDIHWVVVGDGREFHWLENRVKEFDLGGTFHLMGRHSVESMPDFFSCADVMLVSLKKEPIFAMTIPGKVQSYMASAKPIVAALDGEGGRIIDESGAGISVEAENAEKLSEAVLAMAEMNEEERLAMGEKGLKYYNDNFDRNMLLEKLDEMMNSVVKGSI